MTLLAVVMIAQKPAVVANDKSGWHKIAETKIDFNKDHDEVLVMVADRFASLKFKITDAPIELLDIDVYFEEGDSQNIKVGFAAKSAGTESREIDLKGGAERNLKKIVFHYRTLENRQDKKGQMEIWGKKTNPGKAKGKSDDKPGNAAGDTHDHK
jgi:hypothetical protein